MFNKIVASLVDYPSKTFSKGLRPLSRNCGHFYIQAATDNCENHESESDSLPQPTEGNKRKKCQAQIPQVRVRVRSPLESQYRFNICNAKF
jgi:hypothetical protein